MPLVCLLLLVGYCSISFGLRNMDSKQYESGVLGAGCTSLVGKIGRAVICRMRGFLQVPREPLFLSMIHIGSRSSLSTGLSLKYASVSLLWAGW